MRLASAVAALLLVLIGSGCRLRLGKTPSGEVFVVEPTSTGAASLDVTNEEISRATARAKPVVDALAPLEQGVSSPRSASVAIAASSTVFLLLIDGTISQWDIPSDTEVRSRLTNSELITGAVSPGNQFLYAVARAPRNGAFAPSVEVLDLTTFQLVASIDLTATLIPNSAAITPDGNFLLIAGAVRALTAQDVGMGLHIVDLRTRRVVQTLRWTNNQGRPEVLVSQDGGRAFVTLGNGGVAVIDLLTQTVSHTIPAVADAGNQRIAIDPAGTTLFVAPIFLGGGQFGVSSYDLATSTKLQDVPVADLSGAFAMTVTADGASLVIDQIGKDPNTGRNSAPILKWFSLPDLQLALTRPSVPDPANPVTVGRIRPKPAPLP